MFASPPIDSHRLGSRDLRGSPLATLYRRSTQELTIITIHIHVSSAHARRDVISFFLFPRKKRKYEVGGIRTHDMSFVCYIALPAKLGSHVTARTSG